jgi:hypothetical protein
MQKEIFHQMLTYEDDAKEVKTKLSIPPVVDNR